MNKRKLNVTVSKGPFNGKETVAFSVDLRFPKWKVHEQLEAIFNRIAMGSSWSLCKSTMRYQRLDEIRLRQSRCEM